MQGICVLCISVLFSSMEEASIFLAGYRATREAKRTSARLLDKAVGGN